MFPIEEPTLFREGTNPSFLADWFTYESYSRFWSLWFVWRVMIGSSAATFNYSEEPVAKHWSSNVPPPSVEWNLLPATRCNGSRQHFMRDLPGFTKLSLGGTQLSILCRRYIIQMLCADEKYWPSEVSEWLSAVYSTIYSKSALRASLAAAVLNQFVDFSWHLNFTPWMDK